MVRDSASELESRYLAVNSCLAKQCSMRKGLICMDNIVAEMKVAVPRTAWTGLEAPPHILKAFAGLQATGIA